MSPYPLSSIPRTVYHDVNYDARRGYRAAIMATAYADTVYAWCPAFDAIPDAVTAREFMDAVESGAIVPGGHAAWWTEPYRLERGFSLVAEDRILGIHASQLDRRAYQEWGTRVQLSFNEWLKQQSDDQVTAHLSHGLFRLLEWERDINILSQRDTLSRAAFHVGADFGTMLGLHADTMLSVGAGYERLFQLVTLETAPRHPELFGGMAAVSLDGIDDSLDDNLEAVHIFLDWLQSAHATDLADFRRKGGHQALRAWLEAESVRLLPRGTAYAKARAMKAAWEEPDRGLRDLRERAAGLAGFGAEILTWFTSVSLGRREGIGLRLLQQPARWVVNTLGAELVPERLRAIYLWQTSGVKG